MHEQQTSSSHSEVLTILLSVLLAAVGLIYFAGYYKLLTLAIGFIGLIFLLRRDLTPLWNIPALLFLGYLTINGLTRFWAISGKFFLREYSELFASGMLFLAVMLHTDFDRRSMRSVLKLLAWVSAIYSFLSVEAATTGFSKTVLSLLIPNFANTTVSFETGTRLTGIIGNANVLSSILAFGIFASICLLCGEEDSRKRLLYAGLSAINAFVFLLLFSMGGTACFVLSVFFYLIFAGKGRSGALIRMLECALPTVVWVFAAFPFFNRSGSAVFVPLCAMAGNILTVILLEKVLGSRMTEVLSKHSKLTLSVFAGVSALACAYIVLGVTLTGAYTFEGERLRRDAYPSAGEHTLSVEASGPVNVTIVSQNMSQVMMHEETRIYSGSAENAVFTVPENSKVCYFTFTAEDGTVLETASLDSGESLKLKYTLLPGFIANRLQGLFANQNAIQRTVFFRDGMKMFRNSPMVGSGVGSFETGITSVQEFLYTTKYIHNHYIQVLLESGIIGFLPYISCLICLVWLLFKHRKEDENWEFSGEYPLLWACFVMTLSHTAVELSMSIYAFNWMAFVLFALIIRCCTPASLRIPELAGRAAALTLSAVFLLSIVCNVAVGMVARSTARSVEEYFQHLELAATADPYEANDAKLSYVLQTLNEGLSAQYPKANKYAEDLLHYQSNTIPFMLTQYYLFTRQYEQAFEAAYASARYSASNAEVWNNVSAVLSEQLMDSWKSPLLNEEQDPGNIPDQLMEYYKLLQKHNSGSMENIVLNTTSMDFFSRGIALYHSDRSDDAAVTALACQLFHSDFFCDADNNGVPDQVSASQNVSFEGEDFCTFTAPGQMTLKLLKRDFFYGAQIAIACQDPASITVTDPSGKTVSGVYTSGVWIAEIPQSKYSNEFTLTIQSSVPQTLTHLEIMAE